MGALHEGHLSLIAAARKKGCTTLASIFVNPRQFNNPDDLLHYPRTITDDIRLLAAAGCNAVFIPEPDQVFAAGTEIPPLDLGFLAERFEGSFRPGHFRGVTDVLWSLFQLIQPQQVYFGAKDFQQCMVVKKLLDVHFPKVQMYMVPTMREADGLAMSSRNRRLSDAARAAAPVIFQALQEICAHKHSLPLNTALEKARSLLLSHHVETEYLELAVPANLDILNDWHEEPTVLLFAGYLDGVRLIDNLMC